MVSVILILKIFFALLFMFAGIVHIIKPKIFKHFIPDYLPKKLINYSVGIVEFIFGLGLLFSSTAKNAAVGILFLLILFLPIHIWDATKIKPAIGKKWVAYLRIPLQFLLLYFIYLIYTNT